jgi:hypothetical protein
MASKPRKEKVYELLTISQVVRKPIINRKALLA